MAQAKYLLVRLIFFGCYSHRQWLQASILPNKGRVADAEVARTRGKFPEPIRITPLNRRVTEQACVSCHAEMAHALLAEADTRGSLSCLHCHRSVGHANR